MRFMFSKQIFTDDERPIFVGFFEAEDYSPITACQPTKGHVQVFLGSSPALPMRTRLFPRKNLKSSLMHKFLDWCVCQNFEGMEIWRVLSRLRRGHDNASIIGMINF